MKKGAIFQSIAGLALGIAELILYYNDEHNEFIATGPAFIIMALFQYLIYLYYKKKGYLIISDGILSKHQYFPKKINLKEVKFIKKFAGEYQLRKKKGDKIDLLIDYQTIDPEEHEKLLEELKKYEIEWT